MMKIKHIAMMAGATVMAFSSPAFAADDTEFTIKRTNSPEIKLSVKAFKSGEYERAAKFNEKALTKGLSQSRQAIAHSNLCASYAMSGDMDKAQAACDTALNLNPELDEAVANKKALTIKLAQK